MVGRELIGAWVTLLLGFAALLGLFWKISRRVGQVSDTVDAIPAMRDEIDKLTGSVGTVKSDMSHVKDELSLNNGRRTLRDLVQRIDVRTEALDQRLSDHIAGGGHHA